MKNLKILLLILFISCSKSKENEAATDRMEVLEYKTNIPLASVQIDFYRCSKYDNIFGCQAKQLFATAQTDNNGKYTFKPGELFKSDQGIVLRKAKYWNTGGGTDQRFMSSEGTIDLHLVRQNNYPDTSLFRIIVAGESGTGDLITFRPPADSVVKVRGFGNEGNTLNWAVIVKDPSCYIYCIIDTLAKGVLTQNLDKFGTSSLTLSY